jgi:hypothetical protein
LHLDPARWDDAVEYCHEDEACCDVGPADAMLPGHSALHCAALLAPAGVAMAIFLETPHDLIDLHTPDTEASPSLGLGRLGGDPPSMEEYGTASGRLDLVGCRLTIFSRLLVVSQGCASLRFLRLLVAWRASAGVKKPEYTLVHNSRGDSRQRCISQSRRTKRAWSGPC